MHAHRPGRVSQRPESSFAGSIGALAATGAPLLEAIVPEHLGGARLDVAVATLFPCVTRTQARHLIEAGRVRAGAHVVDRPSGRARAGVAIAVAVPDPQPSRVAPEPIGLTVVYEDADLAVVDKPAGMVVHPAPGHPDGTLVNAALHRFGALPSPSGATRSGIVHRLDKETSGLLLIAKTELTLLELQRQFKSRLVEKSYVALVRGHPPFEGVIDEPIGRDPRDRKRMAIVPTGRPAITAYSTLVRYRRHALLRVAPATGRTHQIRVHLAALGTPVAGDRLYGRGTSDGFTRQFLHAQRLAFDRRGGIRLVCTSALPPDLLEALAVAGEREPWAWAGTTGYARAVSTVASASHELGQPNAEEVEDREDGGEDDG